MNNCRMEQVPAAVTTKKQWRRPIFAMTSVAIYLAEVTLTCLSCVHFYQQEDYVLFACVMGFWAFPTILVQIVSYHWSFSVGSMAGIIARAFIHILMASLPWRYLDMCLRKTNKIQDTRFPQVMKLRLFLTFCSSIPILCVMFYLLGKMVTEDSVSPKWLFITNALVSLISAVWVIASTSEDDSKLLAMPGIIFKFLWHLGELFSRTAVIILFVFLYGYWVCLVCGLHWVTMFLILLATRASQGTVTSSANNCRSVFQEACNAHILIFCYLSLKSHKDSRIILSVYYVIQSLESAVLLILWLVFDQYTKVHLPVAITIVISYLLGIGCAVLYFKCFAQTNDHAGQSSARPRSTSSTLTNSNPRGSVASHGTHSFCGGFFPDYNAILNHQSFNETQDDIVLGEDFAGMRRKMMLANLREQAQGGRNINQILMDYNNILNVDNLPVEESDIDQLYKLQKTDSTQEVDSGLSTLPTTKSTCELWSLDSARCRTSGYCESNLSSNYPSEDLYSSVGSEATVESFVYREDLLQKLGSNLNCYKCGKHFVNHIRFDVNGKARLRPHQKRLLFDYGYYVPKAGSVTSECSSSRRRSRIRMGTSSVRSKLRSQNYAHPNSKQTDNPFCRKPHYIENKHSYSGRRRATSHAHEMYGLESRGSRLQAIAGSPVTTLNSASSEAHTKSEEDAQSKLSDPRPKRRSTTPALSQVSEGSKARETPKINMPDLAKLSQEIFGKEISPRYNPSTPNGSAKPVKKSKIPLPTNKRPSSQPVSDNEAGCYSDRSSDVTSARSRSRTGSTTKAQELPVITDIEIKMKELVASLPHADTDDASWEEMAVDVPLEDIV